MTELMGGDTSLRQYFKAGVRNAIQKHGAASPDQSNLLDKFGSRDMRRRVALALDNQADTRRFVEHYAREQRMFMTGANATGQPQPSQAEGTLRRQRDLDFALTRLGTNPTSPFTQYSAGKTIFKSASAKRENEMWNAISQALTTPGPEAMPSAMRDMINRNIPWGATGGVAANLNRDK